MNKNKLKRNLVLGILFFLPVAFLLFLYPSTHNYNPLDIVNQNIPDIQGFSSESGDTIVLENHITVLGFVGTQPMEQAIDASNIKELVYDKFKGFKGFQIVFVAPNGSQEETEKLKSKINSYEDARFWHYVFGEPEKILNLYNRLKSNSSLKVDFSSNDVFIIDKDLNQRGRLDDRDKREIKGNGPIYPLYAYNSIDIGTIKNKMSDDMRVLFTEYRDKRRGKFDSAHRRANDLSQKDE